MYSWIIYPLYINPNQSSCFNENYCPRTVKKKSLIQNYDCEIWARFYRDLFLFVALIEILNRTMQTITKLNQGFEQWRQRGVFDCGKLMAWALAHFYMYCSTCISPLFLISMYQLWANSSNHGQQWFLFYARFQNEQMHIFTQNHHCNSLCVYKLKTTFFWYISNLCMYVYLLSFIHN